MIKYKDISEMEVRLAELPKIREQYPVKLLTLSGHIIYTIPWNNNNTYSWNFIAHTDIPKKINYNNILWCWYGNNADSREQWLDPEWRKKIEINLFL